MSRRIRLIVTGDLERKALVPSLRAQLPETDLNEVTVTWLPPRKVHGATSHRLRANEDPSNTMRTLARAVLSEALDGSDGRPSDLVVAVDDLELHNVDQPQVVCQHFVAAMQQELSRRDDGLLVGEQADMRDRIRRTCSFHLVNPMIESYMFGEPGALVRAGCANNVCPELRSTDWEDFWVTDQSFLEPHCNQENKRKAAPPLANVWWREERHAKHYLEHLINHNGGSYEETAGGARALAELDWSGVARDATECPLLRALFEDLADFFGSHSPLGPGAPSPHTWAPANRGQHQGRTLRNM